MDRTAFLMRSGSELVKERHLHNRMPSPHNAGHSFGRFSFDRTESGSDFVFVEKGLDELSPFFFVDIATVIFVRGN